MSTEREEKTPRVDQSEQINDLPSPQSTDASKDADRVKGGDGIATGKRMYKPFVVTPP
jgi:hypothetical protein